MKLVRYEYGGKIGIGAVVENDTIVVDLDAGASVAAFLSRGAAGLANARKTVANPVQSRLPVAGVRLLAPVGDPNKILCIGQNYRDHCEEQNQPIPDRAILFSKYATALNDPNADIPLLAISPQIDY